MVRRRPLLPDLLREVRVSIWTGSPPLSLAVRPALGSDQGSEWGTIEGTVALSDRLISGPEDFLSASVSIFANGLAQAAQSPL